MYRVYDNMGSLNNEYFEIFVILRLKIIENCEGYINGYYGI